MSDTPEPKVPIYGVTSEPLPMQPEMFEALGQIVVLWSRIENAVVQDLHDMRKWPIAEDIAEEIPRTFDKKLELWRKSVRALYPKVVAYQGLANQFSSGAKDVAGIRNHLIHGTWALEADENEEFKVTNIRRVKGDDRIETLWVGTEKVQALLNDVLKLDSWIMGFIVTKMLHAHAGLLQVDREP
jgi:hypothetical protein